MADLVRNLLFSLFVIVLISLAASDISVQNVKCEMTCALNYSQNAAEVGYCCRGCRLMRLADFTNYGPLSRDILGLSQICTDSCASAYNGEATATAACQRGCKLELPAVQNRLRQLEMFYYEQAKYIQMFDVINKLMSCRIPSFMNGPQQMDRPGDYQFRARVIFFSSGGRSVSGISVSRGSEASVETERSEAASNEHKLTSRMLDAKSRLYTRIRGSDPAIVLLFLFGFVLLIGLSVSLCFPAQHTPLPAKPQKLSIYGDGDFLSTLDEDDALIDIKPRAQMFVAAPLPAKYPL